tara:strand:- start:304 stop:972 length:669 start_codon:yes stop_codon:yes gene_type:complete
MVNKNYRGKKIYEKLVKFSSKELEKLNVSIILAWPNLSNLKSSLMHENFYPIMQLPILKLSQDKKYLKLKKEVHMRKLQEEDLEGIENSISPNFLVIKKDRYYLKDRYLNHPNNSYYCDKFTNSLIIYSILSNRINILEFFSKNGDITDHLKSFIDLSKKANLEIQAWCSIFDKKKYSSFIRCGFAPSNPIINCGFYPLTSFNYKTILTHRFILSMGDTDVF